MAELEYSTVDSDQDSWEPEDPIAALAAIEAELTRREFLANPVYWNEERLHDFLWSVQKQILEALAVHRRVAVRSCHEVGKSFLAGRIAAWWIDTSPVVGDAFVVTSAPSGHQVRAILWKEIGRAHTRGNLRGRLNQTEWLQETNGGKEEQVAFGRKPDDMNPDAFQGIHARRVLVIFDEANGIRGPLWEAADTLIANDESKMLCIGNPDDPVGEFYEACRPGSGWHVIEIGAFDSPTFTGEPVPTKIAPLLIGRTYVDEKRRKWAPNWYWVDRNGQPTDNVAEGVRCVPPDGVSPTDTNPLWQSKILGKFPENSETGGLIPISWVLAAQNRALPAVGPNEMGQDVGGGGDSSCTAHRRGPVVRIKREDHNPDTMQTCGHMLADLKEVGATLTKVDVIGIGRGIVDRAKEVHAEEEALCKSLDKGPPKWKVVGINVSGEPQDKTAFINLRAELWWNIRGMFEAGTIDIDSQDEDLAAELCSIRYKRTSSGKIQIESKDEAKRRGIPSPNRADALMLAFAPEIKIKDKTWVTW